MELPEGTHPEDLLDAVHIQCGPFTPSEDEFARTTLRRMV
jgi:hypothetical protein